MFFSLIRSPCGKYHTTMVIPSYYNISKEKSNTYSRKKIQAPFRDCMGKPRGKIQGRLRFSKKISHILQENLPHSLDKSGEIQ